MKYLRQVFLITFVILSVTSFAFLPLVSSAQPVTGREGTGVSNSGMGPFALQNPLKGTDVNSLQKFLVAILNNIALPIGSVIVVMFIIYSGFLFVTARGDVKKLEAAKQSLLNVVIGTAILFGAVAISYAIGNTICQIADNKLPGCPDIGRLPR